MLRLAVRRGVSAVLDAQKKSSFRTATRMASGPRAAPEDSSLVQFGTPSSLRELQASLPALQQRGKPKKEIRIKQTKLKDDDAVMEISWYDGQCSNYPYVWLRDNCQCESCYDQYEKKRKTMDSLVDDNKLPEKAKNLQFGTLLHLTWSDGHDSYYSANWLQEHCFERGMLPYIRQNYSPKPSLWNASLCDSMKKNTLKFDDLIDPADDSKILEWLATLQAVGFAKITGAPVSGDGEGLNAIHALISRCSPTTSVKHHDRGPFNTFDSSDAGYQTSLPYFHHVPGIQLLHCDSPANESTLFVDGFAVANAIQEKFPEAGGVFDMLCKLDVAFQDEAPGETEAAKKFLRRRLAPTFELNKQGEVWRFNYNNECRDSAMKKFDGLEQVQDLYFCLQEMEKEMEMALNHASGFEYHMQPGDIICVDNWRVAVRHGNGGLLNQAFFDWDEAKSKVNVLSGQHRDLRYSPEI